MSDSHQSCLVTKLSHYVTLSEHSCRYLARFEEDERDFGKHEDVRRNSPHGAALYVVKRGWLYSYMDMPDGRRQIVKIHHPGDIIGFQDITLSYSTTTLRTAERVTLCPFPKKHLDAVFTESPQLTALLFSLAVREQTILTDHLRAMGRMSAREKLGYLLLELLARLRCTKAVDGATFRFPLNQTEIADAVGLTNVYVSRTMQTMEEEGYIARQGDRISVLRERELAMAVDFEDRYLEIDTSWFPNADEYA